MWFGDQHSSAKVIRYTSIMMGLSTVMIGVLPTYEKVGLLSPLCLILLRVIQGFASGGELPVTASYIYANTTLKPKQILLCALPSVGSMSGALLASVVSYALFKLANMTVIEAWAWRIPFLLGLPLFIIILQIRRVFNLGKSNLIKSLPAYKLDSIFILKCIFVFILTSFLQICFYILFVWLPNYLELMHKVSHSIASFSNVLGILSAIVFTIIWGYLATHYNYKKILFCGVFGITVLIYPLLLNIGVNLYFIFWVQILFGLLIGCIDGVFFYSIVRVFPSGVQNRGVSILFTCASAYFGGTAPLICSYMNAKFNFQLFPAIYVICWGVITLLSMFILRLVNGIGNNNATR